MEGETSTGSSASAPRGRGRGTALPPLALRRSLLESISSPRTSEVPRERGGRAKKAGGREGGGRGRGRRTAAPSSLPPSADSPEHRVDPSSKNLVVVEEEATSQPTSWGVWPEVQTPGGRLGPRGRSWRCLVVMMRLRGGEGTTVY